MSAKALRRLEERIARLEEELTLLKAEWAGSERPATTGWRALAGSHEGSPFFEAMVKHMRRHRREDYAAAKAAAGAKRTHTSNAGTKE